MAGRYEWQTTGWSEMIQQHIADNKASWAKAHRASICDTYILIDPFGKRYTTKRLTLFCDKHNLPMNRLLEVASFMSGGPLIRRPHWKNWICYKRGHLKNNRIRKLV